MAVSGTTTFNMSVDEIIIESLQEKLENLEEEDSEKNKEYIAAFEMVIDWHGG